MLNVVPPREKVQKVAIAATNIDQRPGLWFAIDKFCNLLE
jgi:hypothetical protein